MNEKRFRSILLELVDENPFAIRAALRILEVEFTNAVPTLAVTCADRPRLLVNLAFVREHCTSDDEVKAVICHEFLHVILRHTEQRQMLTPARHLAVDAVINAIIHRQYGPGYSGMMGRYYADAAGRQKLLRPMNGEEHDWLSAHSGRDEYPQLPYWIRAWSSLYAGRLIVDDIEALATHLAGMVSGTPGAGPFTFGDDGGDDAGDLLGNHDELGRELSGPLQETLEKSMREMNGRGIWRSPGGRGVGCNSYEALVASAEAPLRQWRATTLAILRRHLTPDRLSRRCIESPHEYRLPVLSPQDRRAFLRSQWAPFLPEAGWGGTAPRHTGTAQVYLDVSGSMSAEMPHLVALLGQLSGLIRRPFWAFSDTVAPAVIERGALKAQTTGGTSMSCVLEHLVRTRPTAAVVVTDGYIEALDRQLVAKTAGTQLHALVSRDGSPAALERAGIACTQLPALKGVRS
ncbi:MAG: hypothetical protein Q7W56_06530 [Candidatus Latescibacteria bacterium]|nr:hypothetical protein [Candidatus Latescibacterota bacterium]